MTTTTTTAPAAPKGARRVACPHCRAATGDACTTPAGRPVREGHRDRWTRYTRRMRQDTFTVRITDGAERLGLTAGERYTATAYWLDPEKVTLLARLDDGHDPPCNQYWNRVEWEAWTN